MIRYLSLNLCAICFRKIILRLLFNALLENLMHYQNFIFQTLAGINLKKILKMIFHTIKKIMGCAFSAKSLTSSSTTHKN